MRITQIISVLLIVLLPVLAACTSPEEPEPTEPLSPSPPPVSDTSPPSTPPAVTCYPAGYTYIDYSSSNTTLSQQRTFGLSKVIWGPYSLYILGFAHLAEGARLKSQLYQYEQVIDWWPEYYGVRLANGTWEFSVKSHEYGAPEELPEFELGYSLRIWNWDNPEVTEQLSLDSPGPPLETRIPGSEGTPLLELEGSRWRLSSLNDAKPLSDTKITLEFREGKASGMSGCNHYGGGYVIKAPNLINIYGLITTLLSCGELSDSQANAYLGYLRNAICYRITDEHLEMYDVITNEKTLVFERQP